jgi:hypothetical protein
MALPWKKVERGNSSTGRERDTPLLDLETDAFDGGQFFWRQVDNEPTEANSQWSGAGVRKKSRTWRGLRGFLTASSRRTNSSSPSLPVVHPQSTWLDMYRVEKKRRRGTVERRHARAGKGAREARVGGEEKTKMRSDSERNSKA